MLSKQTFKFLSDLKKHNDREWFEKNKKSYEAAQAEIKDFIAEWLKAFSKKDESLSHLEPKNCLFRIYRDVRFSADKSPYKTNLGAYINKGGKNGNTAGYYLHIEPGNCFYGAGNYMPTPEQLAKIRQEIDYNFSDFNKLISGKKFKDTFGDLMQDNKLKKPPRGYDENNPAIEFLKLKGFTIWSKLKDEEVLDKNFIKQIVKLSEMSQPFIEFLNTAVEE